MMKRTGLWRSGTALFVAQVLLGCGGPTSAVDHLRAVHRRSIGDESRASVVQYACQTGVDRYNEPSKTFSITSGSYPGSFNQTLLDEANRIWSATFFTNETNVTVVLGQMPDRLPPDEQMWENLAKVTSAIIEPGAPEFEVDTEAYTTLAGPRHVNFHPYVDCKRK